MKKLLRSLSFLITVILLGNRAFAQAPTISYGAITTFTYPVNNPITSLTPTSSNVTGTFAPTTNFSANGTSFIVVTYDPVSASFLAVDNAGNLDRINATTGAISQLNTTVLRNDSQLGIITDGLGNIYVTDNSNNDVYEFNAAGNTVIRTITGFNNPNGLAVDASNNVYVADSGTDDIYKIPAGTTNTKTILLTGFTNPYGLAINGTDLYVSQNGGTAATRSIIKVAGAISGGTTKTTFASGFTNPLNLTFDSFGDLFVADGTIKMVTPAGTVTNTLVGANAFQVDFDPSGNLYIADGGRIKQSLVTYYSINNPLPTGLQFNTSTGVISGTPTVVTAAANYIITAHNTTSNTTTTLNIAVVATAPSLTYTNATLTFGTAATITPINSGSSPTTCSTVPTLPAGLTISNTTGIISGTPTAITVGATTYVVTAKNGVGTTTSTVTITVNPAPLTITANNLSKTYGAANPALTITYTGFVNGNTSASLTTQPIISTTATTGSAVGSYPISISGAVDLNYTITYTNGTLTVNPATLTITAKPQSKTFGSAFTFAGTEYTETGLISPDAITGLTITSTGSAATATVAGSPYPIVPSAATGSGLSNYNINYVNGLMTVNKAALAITIKNQTKVYGATFTFVGNEFTAAGLQNSDAINTLTFASTGSAATATVAGSPYSITASTPVGNASFSANNYTITYTNGAMTVAPAPLTITGTVTKTYGTLLSGGPGSGSFTSSGLQNGQSISSVTIAYGAAAAASTAVGTYTAQATPSAALGITTSNYTITYTAGSIVVTQAALTITANNAIKTKGNTLTGGAGSTAFTSSGLLNGETLSSVTIAYGAAAASGAAIGTYPNQVTPSAPVGSATFNTANYTISYVLGSIIITDIPPVIAYNTPNLYTENVAIPTLGPSNTGGAVPAPGYSTATSLSVTPNLNGPEGMATNAAGNLYVTNSGSGTVDVFNSSGTSIGTFGSGFTTPVGIVFDSSGNAYILDSGTKKVYEYNSSGSLINTITVAGLSNNLTAIAIDASNNLYIADSNNNKVVEFNTSGTVLQTITSNINAPTGIAIDPSGNIYVSNYFNFGSFKSQITEYNASGTYLNTPHTDPLGNISALTIDSFGNLYYTDDSPFYETLYKYSSTGALINTITGLNAPEGITVDKSGNLYISDINNNTVNKYSLTGGYYLTGVLPPGLSFNNTTGQITGTPTTTFATTSYTVTAFNSGGSATSNTFTLSCAISFDWVGTTSTNWNTTTNWLSQTVPGTSNTALIGVNVNFTNFPTVSTAGTTTVGGIQFGTTANQQAGVAVNTGCTLNVLGAITYQSDAKSFTNNAYVCTISGAGTLTAASLNINANTTLAGQSYTEKLASSLTNLQISGNVVLTSTNSGASLYNSTFNVIGGVTTLTGVLQSNNSSGSTSTFGVNTTGTLQFVNAAALSGLSATGTNILSFNNTGATIGYTGAAQTIYTDAVISGLAAGPSYYSIAFSGTGAKTPNAGKLNIAGNFTNTLTNDASNYVTLTGTPVFFNGTTQTLAGGVGETAALPALTSTGTVLTNVTFSGAGTKTISSGVFHITSNGLLNMSGTNALTILAVGASGNLTLISDNTGSATVPAFTGPKITGNVDVQRYLSGSTTVNTYRGYRLLSSPVATSTTSGIYSLNYVGSSTYITGTDGTLGGFYQAGNPSLYLYRDNLAPSNATFTSGNFRGVSDISLSPNYYLNGDGGPFNIPVGNGFLFFDRGAKTNPAAKFVAGAIAESITLTATGTINAGQVIVKPWFEPTSTNLDYTAIAGNSGIIGFALAGNPYPSSIDWNNYSASSAGAGIYGPATNGNIYIMDPVSQNYDVYNPTLPNNTSAQGKPNANIIPSGQGFFVQATSSSAQLIFNESAKTNGQASTANGNLFLGAPPLASITPYLRLKLVLDSVHTDGLIILFNNSVKATYDINKDAKYRQGNGTVSVASMSADSVALAINTTPFPQATRVIPLKVGASTNGIYHLNMTAMQSIPDLFDIWLMDAYKKDSLDIKHNPEYSFNVHINDPASFGAGRFTLVIRQNPALGLHLLNFAASKAINGAEVVWVTENEENYTNFTVERSTDGGVTYQVLGGFVSSDQGTYSFLDKNPADLNQYRLKLVDLNGVTSYSKVVTIMYGSSNTLTKNSMGLYPNPTNSKLNLTIVPAIVSPSGTVIPPNSARAYGIKIVNNTGGVIQTATINSTSWQTDVSSLIPGTYIIQVIDNTYNSLVGRSTFIKL